MQTELDHIFICVSKDAPEAEQFSGFGLTEGASNTHPGQGTACRRFFFHNAYLELLWVTNPAEAQSEGARRTRLWERWTKRGRGACPFGLGFRPEANHAGRPPFAAWDYRPPYLPEQWSIQVAKNSDALDEPMLFYLSFAQRPDSQPSGKRQPLEHALGVREISRVALETPHAQSISPELEALESTRLIRLCQGANYLIELGFDGEAQGKSLDFRPGLPLVFHW